MLVRVSWVVMLGLLLAVAPRIRAAVEIPPRLLLVGVVDDAGADAATRQAADLILELTEVELSHSPAVALVTRDQMSRITRERELTRASPATDAAALARLLKADLVALGNIEADDAGRYRLRLRIVESASAAIRGDFTVPLIAEALTERAFELAQETVRLATDAPYPRVTIIVAPVENRGRRQQLDHLEPTIRHLLVRSFLRYPAIRVLERESMTGLIEEQDLYRFGFVDGGTFTSNAPPIPTYYLEGGYEEMDAFSTNRLTLMASMLRLSDGESMPAVESEGGVTNLAALASKLVGGCARLLLGEGQSADASSVTLDLAEEFRLLDQKVQRQIKFVNRLEWRKESPEVERYLRGKVINNLECMAFLAPESFIIRAALGLHLFRYYGANGGSSYHWHGGKLDGAAAERTLRVLHNLADTDRDGPCGQWALALIPSVYRRGPLQTAASSQASDDIRRQIAKAVEQMMETDFVPYEVFRDTLASSPYVPIRWAHYMKRYNWIWNRIWTDSFNFNVHESLGLQDKARVVGILESFVELMSCTEAKPYGWRFIEHAMGALLKLADEGYISHTRALRTIDKLALSGERLTAERALTARFNYHRGVGDIPRAIETAEALMQKNPGDATTLDYRDEALIAQFLHGVYEKAGDTLNARRVMRRRGHGFVGNGRRLANDEWYKETQQRILSASKKEALDAWEDLYAYIPHDPRTYNLFVKRFQLARDKREGADDIVRPLDDASGVSAVMHKRLQFGRKGDDLIVIGPLMHYDLNRRLATVHRGRFPGSTLRQMAFSDPWLWITLEDKAAKGLWRHHVEGSDWERVATAEGELPSDAILALPADGGDLLIGFGTSHRGGLARLTPDLAWRGFDEVGAPREGVAQIVVGEDAIWVATISRVYVFDRKNGDWQQAAECEADQVWKLQAAPDGIFATRMKQTGSGGRGPISRMALVRFSLADDGSVAQDEVAPARLRQTLFHDEQVEWVLTPAPDPVQDLPLDWYNDLRLAAIDRHSGLMETFGARHGLPPSFRDRLQYAVRHGDHVWFITPDELYSVSITELTRLYQAVTAPHDPQEAE